MYPAVPTERQSTGPPDDPLHAVDPGSMTLPGFIPKSRSKGCIVRFVSNYRTYCDMEQGVVAGVADVLTYQLAVVTMPTAHGGRPTKSNGPAHTRMTSIFLRQIAIDNR